MSGEVAETGPATGRRGFRRARAMHELQKDPAFAFHVGQLIGAAEMAAHWMRLQDDAAVKSVGGKLAETVAWFFREGESDR